MLKGYKDLVGSLILCTFAVEISNGTEDNIKTITIMNKKQIIERAFRAKAKLDQQENKVRNGIYARMHKLLVSYGNTIVFDNPIWVANWDDPEYPLTITEVRGTTDGNVEVHYKNNNMELDDWDDFGQYATSDMSYVLDRAIDYVQIQWNVKL